MNDLRVAHASRRRRGFLTDLVIRPTMRTAIHGHLAKRRALLTGWLVSIAIGSFACRDSKPTAPSPPPPVTPNDTPTISSLTLSGVRAEAGEDLQATATVQDADTPVDQLDYQWSATPVNGLFSGTGQQVKWTPPRGQPPALYSLTLKVTERYVENGSAKENTAASSAPVHYNDSNLDITTIGMRFLTELFPDFSVPAPQAVQDFSDSCRGKAAELSDVANNRVNFHILSGTYRDTSITFNRDRTFADMFGTCVFEDVPTNRANPLFGRRERVTGICHLTATYENWHWFLCDSTFRGLDTSPESVRGRVPGRILQERE